MGLDRPEAMVIVNGHSAGQTPKRGSPDKLVPRFAGGRPAGVRGFEEEARLAIAPSSPPPLTFCPDSASRVFFGALEAQPTLFLLDPRMQAVTNERRSQRL
jgi:hypothetical protein